MEHRLERGTLLCTDGRTAARLTVAHHAPGAASGEALPLVAAPPGWRAANEKISLHLLPSESPAADIGGGRLRVRIAAKAEGRAVLTFTLEGPRGEVYHLVAGFLFGDNNLAVSGPNHFPNLTRRTAAGPSCAPRWEMRTDRAAAPVAMALGDAGAIAVAGPPYLGPEDAFLRTGLIAALPATVGLAVGYRNHPRTFVNKDLFEEGTEARLRAGASVAFDLDLFLASGVGRRYAFDLCRRLYRLYHQPPAARLSAREAIAAVARALVEDAWDETHRAFIATQVKGLPGQPQYRKVGGRAIAWVGGASVAFPLLWAGLHLGDDEAAAVARKGLHRIAGMTNPRSGLFFDAFEGDDWHGGVNYWWSGICNRDRHSAYTNAEAAYSLLRADALLVAHGGRAVTAWRRAALRVLETMLTLQRADGHFGYAYHTDRPAVADWEGFAGCWFVPAMALAYRLTGEARYLDAARRALECYADPVRALECWGTPMDTYKANDEEGVLAFLRGARLLHEITGEDRYLDLLALGADYEFLWRYLYNARPEAEPLRSAGWCSSGGSITSVSNPHIHPMGLLAAGDLAYLAERRQDAHVAQRLEDSLVWARNGLDLWPEKTGFGRKGWTGERFCPSDGLLIQRYADGSPSSIEHAFNLWAASAFLEGLLRAATGDPEHRPARRGR